MTDIEVVAHGDRWAVRQAGDTRSEHLTRQEAESEARRLGAAAPAVREDDPTGLAAVQDRAGSAGDGRGAWADAGAARGARRAAGRADSRDAVRALSSTPGRATAFPTA